MTDDERFGPWYVEAPASYTLRFLRPTDAREQRWPSIPLKRIVLRDLDCSPFEALIDEEGVARFEKNPPRQIIRGELYFDVWVLVPSFVVLAPRDFVQTGPDSYDVFYSLQGYRHEWPCTLL